MSWELFILGLWRPLIPALAAAAWPVCILIGVLVLAPKVTPHLGAFFKDRDFSLKGLGVEAELRRQQSEGSPPVPDKEPLKADDASKQVITFEHSERWLVRAYEIETDAGLATVNPDARYHFLLRWYAQARADLLCEWIYNRIFGSQIVLLQFLNNAGGRATLAEAKGIYAAPASAAITDFDSWIQFLTLETTCLEQHGDQLLITEIGREFLAYLATHSLAPTARFG